MIPVKIGRDYTGKEVRLDFSTHLLIAGQSGSGKSVMLNTIITQIYATDPTAQFYLFDMKYVELIRYRFLSPVCCDLKTMLKRMRYLNSIMMDRYEQCVSNGDVEYKENPIYIVIDEYADITSRSLPEERVLGKQIQAEVERMARMGRACNMHLIICTQYPVASVCSMTIRQQCEVKLCMKCNTSTGYMVVLGHMPHRKPDLGKGQCVMQLADESEILFQGTFTSNDYVKRFVDRYKEALPEWYKKELAKANDIKRLMGRR